MNLMRVASRSGAFLAGWWLMLACHPAGPAHPLRDLDPDATIAPDRGRPDRDRDVRADARRDSCPDEPGARHGCPDRDSDREGVLASDVPHLGVAHIGPTGPSISDAKTAAGRAKNRRCEFLILAK